MKKLYELQFYTEDFEPTCSLCKENGAKNVEKDTGYICDVVEVDYKEYLKSNGIFNGDMDQIEDLKIYNADMTLFEYIIKVLKGE